MKARPKGKVNKMTQQIINDEIRKYLLAAWEDEATCYDAIVLLTLAEKYGFGKRRLRAFYENYEKMFDELHEYYAVAPLTDKNCKSETEFYALENLRKIGVDLKRWRTEKSNWNPENDEVWKGY